VRLIELLRLDQRDERGTRVPELRLLKGSYGSQSCKLFEPHCCAMVKLS